jgi:hypothetical protein
MKKARIVFLIVFVIALLAVMPVGQAQTTRGRVVGIVTDASKAIIVNASVTLVNAGTNIKTVRQTSGTGLYVFDNLDPGTYSVTVEMAGFNKFVQENILVQTGAEVTVDAALSTGSVQTSVTINEAPAAVDFSTADSAITIDQKMANDTPRFDRNPFKLTLIAPTATNTRGENEPFNSWGPNSIDLGGGTNLANQLTVDGAPITMGYKSTVVPNLDDVQEIVVSTNSVDAETGHSAGGAIAMTTKSGTNQWHGAGFYNGRYPWANAEADRSSGTPSTVRWTMYGGTLGNPILKNKWFNFFSYEDWKIASPGGLALNTVPTAGERTGDFSASVVDSGAPDTIYDPWTSAADGSRTPFAGNIIPAARIVAPLQAILAQVWSANTNGIGPSRDNDFSKNYAATYDYYNYTEKSDYNINDKWKVTGRYSRYHTINDSTAPTGSNLTPVGGSYRAGRQAAGDLIWTISPRTVLTVHGDYNDIDDNSLQNPTSNLLNYTSLWPGNAWYAPYKAANPNSPNYAPDINVYNAAGNDSGLQTMGGGPGYEWTDTNRTQDYNVKISHQAGSHYLKAGVDYRRSQAVSSFAQMPQFNFASQETASNWINGTSTLTSGNGYASMLLGALNSGVVNAIPAAFTHTQFYGFYFQDDWKLNRRITLNLGLRDEYEMAWYDPLHQLAQGLDLTAPNPAFASGAPPIPASVASVVGSNFYSWNGAWSYTSSSHPGMWNPQKLALAPRFGIAYKIDDRTALRFGYALYWTPTESLMSNYDNDTFIATNLYGYNGSTNIIGSLAGIPQQTFQNPFPAGLNPILGNQSGPQFGTGNEGVLEWFPKNLEKAHNNRLNLNIQHEFKGQFVVSGTYFTNFGSQWYTLMPNLANPVFMVNNESLLTTTVANPFYHLNNNPTLVPGTLYNQQTVGFGSLLSKYPQYGVGNLVEPGMCCAPERYNSIELKAQRTFSKGFNLLFTYVYIREKTEQNNLTDYDYYANLFQWVDSNQPRHKFNAAGTYQLPFGKGRQYLNTVPTVADYIIGGWQLTGLLSLSSGDFITFGNLTSNPQNDNMIVTGSPCISNPTPNAWFNTSVFQPLPSGVAFTPRTMPYTWPCLTGPSFSNLDGSVFKDIPLWKERVKGQIKVSAFNALNVMHRGDPNTGLGAGFGQALYSGTPGGSFAGGIQNSQNATQGNLGQYGRMLEFSFRVSF